MRFRFALLGALALAFAAPAHAQQDRPTILGGGRATANFLGITGLLYTPSAYTVGERGVAGHVHGHTDFWSGGALVGPFERLEVGATYINFHGNGFCDDGDAVLLNGKFQLIEESRILPAISAGVVDALDEFDIGQSWFVVGSKDISRLLGISAIGVRVHAGVGGGIYDEEPFFGGEVDLGRFGPDLPLTQVRTTAFAEYINGDVNLGLRAKWNGFGITFGVFDFNDFGGGISYTTGLNL